jgi:hypothetical protein
LVLVAPAAFAVPSFDASRTGIDGLLIGGTPYDITFTTSATFDDVYTTLPFNNEVDADVAMTAILDFLNTNAGRENLSTTLVPAPLFQELRIPFLFTNGANTIFQFSRGQGQNLPPTQWSVPVLDVGQGSIFTATVENASAGTYWASFTVVPEPSTGVLLSLGLLGLGVGRRQRS